MKKIALIAQKGGVGKTTMAVNLAVAAGPKTALFDLDPQESAVIWADRRKAESPHVEFLTERRLPDGLKAAETAGLHPRHHRHAARRRPAGLYRRAGSRSCPHPVPAEPGRSRRHPAHRPAHQIRRHHSPMSCSMPPRRAPRRCWRMPAPLSKPPGLPLHRSSCVSAAPTVPPGRWVKA